MRTKLQKLKEKLLALKAHIQFRKVVLEQSVPDRKLLQTANGKRREYSVTEMATNLEKVMEFCLKHQKKEHQKSKLLYVLQKKGELSYKKPKKHK